MPGDARGPGIETIAQHLGHQHPAPRPVREDQYQVGQGGSGSTAIASHLIAAPPWDGSGGSGYGSGPSDGGWPPRMAMRRWPSRRCG